VTITVDDLSNFNPLQDTVKVCGDSIVLDAGAGFTTYNWSNGATTRTISVKASGKYFVTVTNASGCSASDTSILSIVKAKILQKDTTICKGSGISIKVDAIGVSSNSIFKGPNQKDSLIISKYLDYRSRSSFTTPNLSPGNYYLKVSGTFSYGAGRLNDAAYDVYNGITSKADRFFSWNEFCVQGDTSCKIYRPSPDVYNSSHVYYYPFTTNGGVQTIYGISDDCCWGDNSGGLTFEFYKQVNNDLLITWSTGDTTTSITVNPTVKTTYRVTVTDGITTCTDSVVVDVSSSELKVTDPVAVCSPAVVNLTAAAITSGSATGLTYTYWRDSSATQALANPDKVSVSGTYYIVGTSSTGCTSAPTAVKVTVNPLPVATIFAPNQTAICDKSTIRLTASGGTTYQWLFNGSIIAGATDSSFAASQAGSYEVNVIAKGCTSKVAAPVNLTLIKAAVPKFSNSSTCIDVPVSFFNETDTTASGSVNYVWDLGDGQTSTLFNPVYTYKKSGAFVVKLKVAPKLCSSLSDSVTKSITVDVPPVGIKYPNVLAVKNKATPLSARFIANGYSYLWTPSTGLNNGAIQKPVFNANQEQLYRVRLTSAGGCITMDTVKVSVYDSSDIFVPKAFSPNKDGKNDLLQPFLVNIVTLKFFKVYNRWGQLMFQSSDSRQGWDGMYNYKPQPLETYTWIAEGVDGNGTTIFRKGQTVLIR
jgi:gliding motility-associated-like protein